MFLKSHISLCLSAVLCISCLSSEPEETTADAGDAVPPDSIAKTDSGSSADRLSSMITEDVDVIIQRADQTISDTDQLILQTRAEMVAGETGVWKELELDLNTARARLRRSQP